MAGLSPSFDRQVARKAGELGKLQNAALARLALSSGRLGKKGATVARIIENFDRLREMVGQEVGLSEWVEVTQEGIRAFADATDDRQWDFTWIPGAPRGTRPTAGRLPMGS